MWVNETLMLSWIMFLHVQGDQRTSFQFPTRYKFSQHSHFSMMWKSFILKLLDIFQLFWSLIKLHFFRSIVDYGIEKKLFSKFQERSKLSSTQIWKIFSSFTLWIEKYMQHTCEMQLMLHDNLQKIPLSCPALTSQICLLFFIPASPWGPFY